MATGLSNKLTGQIGEYLACAQLGKLGYLATTFSGNVPHFDIVITNNDLLTIPIQVKTTRGSSFQSNADNWMNIEINQKNKSQKDLGDKIISNPNLIYICISLSSAIDSSKDRFFILLKKDLQKICINNYRNWMEERNWKRPKNYESLDNRYHIKDLIPFENNWSLIDKMAK
jgi:hypothetical protein